MNQIDDRSYDDLEIASTSVVMQAARDFAAALSETPQFASFEKTALAFRQDPAAQHALEVVQEKQKSLRGLQMLNALSAEQRHELENLENAFTNQPVVQEYFAAEAELTSLCQALGDALSGSIGLNYAAACGSSCCG